MDLIKFSPMFGNSTFLENGEPILGYDSVMWIERYRTPGEFEIKAKLSSGLMEFLPEESLISHMDTYEVMIVENIEIEQKKNEDPEITITGRDFSSYFENRVTGKHLARGSTVFTLYYLPADNVWDQIVTLILQEIDWNYTSPHQDNVPDFTAEHTIAGTGVSEARTIERGPLLDRVQELLEVEDLGIRTIRRNSFGLVGSADATTVTIYKGEDKTNSVVFSHEKGDIESATYLRSIRGWKNAAVITSRWYNVVIQSGTYREYNRRFVHVDASDLDSAYGSPPADIIGEVSWLTRLATRGVEALAARPKLHLARADISKNARYEYRVDYNLGDLVTLHGNFGAAQTMRVVEYTEIQDENGESGHPTLELPRG